MRHGHNPKKGKPHPTYVIWCGIKQRILNCRNQRYADYGGRGITICEEWLDYVNFYNAVGDPPFAGASLDRLNNDAGYYPHNVRWASKTEQSRNRRGRRTWNWNGIELMLCEWAEVFELPFDNLRARLNKTGTLYKHNNHGQLVWGELWDD